MPGPNERPNERQIEASGITRRRALILLAVTAGLTACQVPAGPVAPTPAKPTESPTIDTAPASLDAATATPAPTATAQPTQTPAPTATPPPPTATALPTNTPTPAGPPPSTLTWVSRAADLAAFSLENTTADGAKVTLARANDHYSSAGQVVSPIRESPFPFDTAVMSWNADAPTGTSLRAELRVRSGAGWSGWFGLGTWSATGGASVPAQSDSFGQVSVDTLKLRAPATAIQYRALLGTSNPTATPALHLLAVTFADRSRQPSGPKIDSAAGRGRDLDVPGFSQVEQDPSIAYEICSPTSLTMALRFFGVNRTVMETVRGVRDASAGMYGNWSLNAAFAGSQGLESWVDRFYSIEQLEASIARGRPVITSVLWRAGELDNAPSPSATTGHLIVVRGFTTGGDVVVNDPLGTGAGIRRVYRRDQFTKIWLGQGGIVYVLGPRA